MKKSKLLINLTIAIVWIILFILIRQHFKISNLNDLVSFIKFHKKSSAAIFLLLSTTRILAFLPGSTFMTIGGVLFDPIEGFILSLISIIISETIIFFVAKISLSKRLLNIINSKYPELISISKKYNYKFLALGILCPAAPSDIACFISSNIGLEYKSFILTVILSNVPVIAIHSVLGKSFSYSFYYFLFGALIFSLISMYLIRFWNKFLKPTAAKL